MGMGIGLLLLLLMPRGFLRELRVTIADPSSVLLCGIGGGWLIAPLCCCSVEWSLSVPLGTTVAVVAVVAVVVVVGKGRAILDAD